MEITEWNAECSSLCQQQWLIVTHSDLQGAYLNVYWSVAVWKWTIDENDKNSLSPDLCEAAVSKSDGTVNFPTTKA